MRCPDDNALAAYFDGALDADDIARTDAHLGECPACRKDLSAMAVVATLRDSDGGDAGEVIPGDRIGRYVLSAEHARGAMGIVASAFDPELGRTIAIKVLQPDISAQLLRQEARAMAKLSHPNVVGVLDVGEHAGRVYLAMELVDGVNLRRWLAHERRDWRTVVRACILAGRGLAAAHRAGLVHRDVKPDNILCGPDDRVRITDFGLAASSATALTGITGTPGYIAPEVWGKEPATPRSDQWSYAATVYEALFGVLPTAHEATRVPITFPARPAVPRRLERALARGLADEPAARHASIDALVAELEAVLRPRWPWLALGAGVVAALAGVSAFALREGAPACEIPAALIDGAWDGAAIERAFAATGRKHAAASAHRVAELFAGYGKRWLDARVDACRATRVVGDQSEALLDVRVRCLDRRRDELAALAGALADHPTPNAVDNAVQAAFALTPVESCAARRDTAEAMAPPAVAARVDAIDRALAEVRAAALLDPHVAASADRARDLVAEARALAYAPLIARATSVVARFASYSTDHARTERELDEALVATAAAHDDESAAEVWLDRVLYTAQTRGDPARALELVPAAEAAMLRADAPPAVRAGLDHVHGIALVMHGQPLGALPILERARAKEPSPVRQATIDVALCGAEIYVGKFAEARDHCARGLATLEHEVGPDHPSIGVTLMSVGNVALELDDVAAARAAYERSAALLESNGGERSVAYALAVNNLGRIAMNTGDLAGARRHLERAVGLLEPLHHVHLASALANLAKVERASGNVALARELITRAVAVATETSGAETDQMAHMLVDRAAIEYSSGDLAAAQASYARALELALELGGETSPAAADALGGLGFITEARGDCRAAIGYYTRAIGAYSKVYGPDDDTVARDVGSLGRCQLELGDAGAVSTLERALAMDVADPAGDPFDRGLVRWDLAQALWQRGGAGARSRALTLAREARALYASSPESDAKDVIAEIDRWLGARGGRQSGRP